MTCPHGTDYMTQCLRCLAAWADDVRRHGSYDAFRRAAGRSIGADHSQRREPRKDRT